MATVEQLEQALIEADKAGNVEDATMLAGEVAKMRESASGPQYGIQAKPPTQANAVDTFLKQSAIPTIGAAGGTILGTAVGGPVGGVIGEALGSGGGEAINQALGITPRSNVAIGLSTALPPLMRGAAAGLQRLPKMLPGASAALQEQAAVEARALPKAIGVPTPSGPLYDAARTAASKSPTKMPFSKTLEAVKKLKAEETGALAGLQSDDLIARLSKMEGALDTGGGLTFSEFDQTVKNLGRKIASTSDDALKGEYKLLYRSLLEDAERMQPPVGVPLDLWKQARTMYRKEMARNEFATMIETTGIKKAGEMLDQVNPNAIANWIKSPKQEFWRKSLEPGELNKINQALKEWASIPTVPVKRGTPIGSGRRLGMIGAGGAVGGYAGGGMGAAVGMLAADKGADLIARAVMSDPGRKMMVKILRASGGKFGQEQAGLLGAFLAGGFADQMPRSEPDEKSYEDGTSYVPKTGEYKLHKGEMVIPKDEAEAIRADPKKWTAFVYGGIPLHHQLSDAHRAGLGREGGWPDFDMQRSPMVGARLQRELTPNMALAIEGWRHRSAMPLLNRGIPFTQEQMTLSPSIQGRLPLDTPIGPMTPYVGAGPTLSRTEQSDQFGASPPGLDLGAQVYGGLEYPLNDRLKALAELKWHRGAITPRDGEGAIHGRLDRLDALMGLGYSF